MAREGGVFVLLIAGHHDDVYQRAERSQFIVNPANQTMRLVVAPAGLAEESRPELAAGAPSIFDHWADIDLRDAGFDSMSIEALRSCRSEDDLWHLDEETFMRATEIIESTPEEWRTPSLLDEEVQGEERLRRAIAEFGALAGLSPLFTVEEVEHLAAQPIEEWMIFLHPDQRAVVERRFEGPARVRGSAGTGKTAVALHRAVELTRRFRDEGEADRRILFTTYISTLPPVLEHLYLRLPGARPEAVQFVNVDKLAHAICREAGDSVRTDPREIDAAFASAWRHAITPHSPIGRAGITRNYLRDEITKVIKGRGVESIDEYLALNRTGRRTGFGEPLRRQTWELMAEWDRQMVDRGTLDFSDVILLARHHAARRASPTYRAAIIDEAQDLTLAGLELVRLLVNGSGGADRPDGLFIVGDGAQRIYAGGFSLLSAGVETRGRTAVLRFNYRNTREILDSAMAVAGDEPVDDLGDEYLRGSAAAEIERRGVRPALVTADSLDDEIAYVCDQITLLSGTGALGFGDIAVCTATNALADRIKGLLSTSGVPYQNLHDYRGVTNERVKVGTFFRAKGLEFKVVFLPGLSDGEFPRPPSPGQDPAEYAEQRSLAISQLFVAMTRARDGLFLTCTGTPSSILGPALDRFELLEL
jgi:hypothetical protein